MPVFPFDPTASGADRMARLGYFDYDDLATASSPITVTGGAGDVLVTNDTLGPQTRTSGKPSDVSRLYNPVGSVMDWSELNIDDEVGIRFTGFLTTLSPNTSVSVDLHLGTGAGAFTIPFISDFAYKSAGVHILSRLNKIYIGDLNTRDNGGQFFINCDNNSTLIVGGWYMSLESRG